MNPQQQHFLNLRSLPGRLNTEETSWFLGFGAHDIPVLVSAGLLKPLGRPAKSGSKYFAGTELVNLRDDPRWLARASDTKLLFGKERIPAEPQIRPVAPNQFRFNFAIAHL